MFDTLEEAQYYQAKYGGFITFISKCEEEEVETVDDSCTMTEIKVKDISKRYYILTLKAPTD